MQLEKFLWSLGFDESLGKTLKPWWREERSPFLPEFLDDDAFYRRWMPFFSLHADLEPAIERTRLAFRREPALALWIRLLMDFAYGEPPQPELRDFPEPVALLGDDAGIPALLAALGALPRIEATFRKLGLPESCLEGSANWISGTVSIYRSSHRGLPGHDLRQTYWLGLSIRGKLFRVGRLEYLIGGAPEWLPPFFRRKSNGAVVGLAGNGWKLTPDGFRADDTAQVVPVRLERMKKSVRGFPIDFRSGRVLPGAVTLPAGEYEPVDWRDQWLPTMHIPGGGGLRPELCRESIREAFAFFQRYFGREIPAFLCESWVLNPAWQRELPGSHLASFQRLGELFPIPAETRSGLFFVFGRDDGNPADYPADNSLRRAFRRVWESGEPFRGGGMIVRNEAFFGVR